jgi:hypothetical protein
MASAPLYLSQLIGGVGCSLHVQFDFSYVPSYSGIRHPFTIHELYMLNFLSISLFHLWVSVYFLVGYVPFFHA